jgi:hypothetical protein
METEYFIETKINKPVDDTYTPNEFPNTWFVENPIDEEHKYYKLMAFLQRIDNNVNNGFIFHEYETLEKRYKDLESFIDTSEIINKDKESEELFNYIYELPSSSIELSIIDSIVTKSIDEMKKKYLELKLTIKYINDNISIVRKEIRDGRKNIHVYIEMCNCGIIEHYTISKKGKVDYLGSFHSTAPLVDDNENNLVEVKTGVSLNSIGIIIPYLKKFSLSRK